MSSSKSFVSLITVNYNGKKYLKNFFESAFLLNYPKEKYEVLMVDNGSKDRSVEFVRNNYPKVKIVNPGINLGFAAGNNLGMKNAKGDLFFLVNNDTILEKDALANIVSTFERWSKKENVGAVNAKMIFIDSYLPLEVQEAHFSDYKLSSNAKPVNKETFVIPHDTSRLFTEKIYLPINYNLSGRTEITLIVKPVRRSDFKISLNGRQIYKGKFKNSLAAKRVKFTLSEKQINLSKVNLIQNAGNFYFRDGYGRDRGAIVIKNQQYYEEDLRQYDKEEYVPGFCGAGVLLNRDALEKVGYFDHDFFMYYEDGELSFRLRENDYRIIYSPGAVIRHIHAGSSGEWSDFFVYNSERGRLLLISKHWPRIVAIKEWVKYIINDTVGVPLYYLLKGSNKKALSLFRIRLSVNISIVTPFIAGLARIKRLRNSELKKFL